MPGGSSGSEAGAGPEAAGSGAPGRDAAALALARRRRRVTVTTTVLAAALLLTCCLSVLAGQYLLTPGQVMRVLAAGPGGAGGDTAASIVWSVRLPRLALALLVGAALGSGGALMQGLFANPLAEPGVIGVSSGAAVGASAAIVLGVPAGLLAALAGLGPVGGAARQVLGAYAVPLAAFVTGVATTVLIYRLARVGGRTRAVALVLVGVAVNAVAGAVTSFLVYLAPTTARDQVVFWQMGSLNGAQWNQVATLVPVVALALAGAVAVAPGLDVLALGERAASQTGVDVERLRRRVVVLTAMLAAAAVSYAGIISFVGLIVPHVLRLVVGPRSRVLASLSAAGGALLVAVADLAARTLIAYTDLPIGIFTALAGGPTFFVLLRRTLAKGELA